MTESMRSRFRQHHRLTDAERGELWENCIFAFDTNVLLNIYRYADATREDLFRVLGALGNRVWIPYQVAAEFYRRRLDVIQQQRSKYQELLTALGATLNGVQDGGFRKSAFLKLDELENIVTPGIERAKAMLEEQKSQHPNLVHEDPYLEKLAEIIGTAIGPELDAETLQTRHKEAQSRIDQAIPPGYRDGKKPVPERFGDVMIWFELLDHAATVSKPIMFITDDDKDDWWQEVSGQKLGPRPELRDEMRRRAGVEFYILKPAYLLEVAGKQLRLDVAESSIDDAKETGAELGSRPAQRPSFGVQRQHVAKLRAFANQRARAAELAVSRWVHERFMAIEVEENWRGFPDLIIEDVDGDTIGVEVTSLSRVAGTFWIRPVLDKAFRGYYEMNRRGLLIFALILVAETEDDARAILARIQQTRLDFPPIHVHVGFLESAVFNEVEEVRFRDQSYE